ncbi:hypothetical protein N7535_005038 [Penicillium sp. DV-2018c]|nr:hypothetical protein N7461_008618 [Penicillium sp. DV-2018c]KAJ5571378.1 hypothetical protein N7535_005038 [Penicillium sp. DV-2018c]
MRREWEKQLKWHYICELSTRNLDKWILEHNPGIDDHSYKWSELVRLAQANTKSWKSKTLARMKDRIKHIVTISCQQSNELPMDDIKDETILNKMFYLKFAKEDFFHCFFWLDGLLDYDKSSTEGQSFLQNVWANLATQVKLWQDLNEAKDESHRQAESKWKDCLYFWDDMTNDEQLAGVTPAIFARCPPRVTSKKGRAQTRTRAKVIYHGAPVRPSTATAP